MSSLHPALETALHAIPCGGRHTWRGHAPATACIVAKRLRYDGPDSAVCDLLYYPATGRFAVANASGASSSIPLSRVAVPATLSLALRALGLTRAALAAELSVTPMTLGRWLRMESAPKPATWVGVEAIITRLLDTSKQSAKKSWKISLTSRNKML